MSNKSVWNFPIFDPSVSVKKSNVEVKGIIKQGLYLFFFGGVLMALIFGKGMGVHDFGSFVRVASFQGLIWVLLWIGNGLISNYLSLKISWLERPEARFIWGIVLTVTYTISALSFILVLWQVLVLGQTFKSGLTFFEPGFFVSALLITALIAMFLHSRDFLREWRASASEAERLRAENLSARFETLKNQVNPHFLFNSLNVLSSLVYKDADKSAKFIKQMSNLYRYVLDTKEKEIVRIEDEENALKAFAYLSEIRFGANLDIQIALEKARDYHIAPMTLQMLVENAIKHNIVSKADPLRVDVFIEDSFIIIRNNLQRKNSVRDSAGIGLPNITARYTYLSDEPVQINESETHFTDKIPLLKS